MYELDNGWIIRLDNGKYLLDVKPIHNSLITKSYTVEIPKEVYDSVKNGMTSSKELYRVHKIAKYVIKWGNPRRPPKKTNTETKYFGRGWFVEQRGEKFFFKYLTGAHGGKSIEIEISKQIYIKARTGYYNRDEILNMLG